MMQEIFEYVMGMLKSRFVPLVLVFVILLTIILTRLFSLQIVNGDTYAQSVTDAQEKTMSVAATRGRIFDCNGILLAYNDLAFSVKISDSGKYSSNSAKNESINAVIDKTIGIIEANGDKVTNDLPITVNSDGHLEFTEEDTALYRFLRDTYGATSINALTAEQKDATANDVYKYLKDKYEVSDEYSLENQLEIINLRRYMSANSYSRYMTFTIAYEVSDDTVAAIMENSRDLVGVTVEETYIRKYVDSVYTSHILGYTGNVSTSELEELQAQDDQYEANDIVGKSGIEQSLELELQGTKGSRKVYVDSVGRITEVVDNTQPQTGNDVYLTIDSTLQKNVYNAIEDELVKILLSKITAGDTTITYTNTGSVDDIFIPIKTVYNALIDNNVISTKKIAEQATDNEAGVYAKLLSKQDSIVSAVQGELTTSPTAYSALSDEMKVYIYYIYKNILCDGGIINTKNIDYSDATYVKWDEDESISLKELLNYALTKNWIDMDQLTDSQYSSLQEAYDALLSYILETIRNDTGFTKRLYRYMISSGTLSGREVCMMLYEQSVIPADEETYASLSSGRLTAYDFMTNAISTKLIKPYQLALEPCSGSAVVADPNTGKILALVSYPGYDNNKLSGTVDSEYYEQLRNDSSKPLINKATSLRTAPGSIFKMCSAIAGLENGVISSGESINCTGLFDKVTPSPKCWIYPSSHGGENVSTALRDSCNVYFYNVGYRLGQLGTGSYNSTQGTDILKKYAEQLGLATKSGIEIYEAEPIASTESAIHSAIGQGSHNYSALNLCRYVATLATSGVCHDFTLVDKVTDSEGNVVYQNEPVVSNTVNVSSSTWTAVHYGMYLVGQNTTAFNNMPYLIAGKSGTAQQSETKPDHITFVSYAPYEDPQVCVSVLIPNGYASSNAGELTAEIYKLYWGVSTSSSGAAATAAN
jgi:penicillin-binding protein 2